jgi:hypothetical protein
MDDFQVPDFVVGTSEGKIIQLESRLMDHLEEAKRRGTLLVQGFDGDVNALDAHPSVAVFAVGTELGTLQIWDMDDRVILATRQFNTAVDKDLVVRTTKDIIQEGEVKLDSYDCVITCVKFAPKGDILAVGFYTGVIKLLSCKADESAGHGGRRLVYYIFVTT